MVPFEVPATFLAYAARGAAFAGWLEIYLARAARNAEGGFSACRGRARARAAGMEGQRHGPAATGGPPTGGHCCWSGCTQLRTLSSYVSRWTEGLRVLPKDAPGPRRFHTVVDATQLDEDRARDWVIVRMTHNALWTIQNAVAAGSAVDAEDQRWIMRCVTVAKAVQD